jgi:hypothetical protein
MFKNMAIMCTRKINLNSYEESFVNGTNDREAYPKRRLAALVQMNTEYKVSARLHQLGIRSYVAAQSVIRNGVTVKKG